MSESAFIYQMTRKLTVAWAAHQVLHGAIPEGISEVYLNHALSKGWISKRDHTKLLSSGFKVAASFLKR